TEFPRVGEPPYFLTLGPYACYWFTLQPARLHVLPAGRTAPVESTPTALPTLLVGVEWENVLNGGTRTVLERQALPAFLTRQRWFGSKSREIRRAHFSDWATIRTGRHPAFLTVVNVEYTDDWTESYAVPLALVSADTALRIESDAYGQALARIAGARK